MLGLALAAGLIALTLPLIALPPASATSTTLCSGYRSCASERLFNGGYRKAQKTMWWRMYSGTNCTNYVAYRMVKGGMPNARPWSSTGNAYNWGHANARITDQTPAVGSVAWFDRRVGGAGSVGHVAYVERVVSASEIVISESNWRGEFNWRHLTKDSKTWPSGFIHFNDKVMENTSAPVISGEAEIDTPLTASAGSWSPTPTKLSYLWLADGAAIPGATGPTFTPTAEQRGKRLSVAVVASVAGYPAGVAYSTETDPVARGRFEQTAPPEVIGKAEVGEVLTATRGGWSPEPRPERSRYIWLANGSRIHGESDAKLEIDRNLAGKRIVAISQVRRAGYLKARAKSPVVGPVVVGRIEISTPYRTRGRRRVGHTLTLRGAFTPGDAKATYAWLRDGRPIPHATAASYVLAPADAGHEVVGQITIVKPNYPTRVERSPAGIVQAPSRVVVRAAGKSRKARVVVRVRAGGQPRPSGEVLIKIGPRQRVVPLSQGKAKVWIRGIPHGKQRVAAKYVGTDAVAKSHKTTKIWVKR